jgi:DNA-binding XRE family transcriptional regulator
MAYSSIKSENSISYQWVGSFQDAKGHSASISNRLPPLQAVPELKRRHRKPRTGGHPEATSCLASDEVTFVKMVARCAAQAGLTFNRMVTVNMKNATRDKVDDKCRQILRYLHEHEYMAYAFIVFEWGYTVGVHAHILIHVEDGDFADVYLNKRADKSPKLGKFGHEIDVCKADGNAVQYITKMCEPHKAYGHPQYWLHPLGGYDKRGKPIERLQQGEPIKGRRWFMSDALDTLTTHIQRPKSKRVAVSKIGGGMAATAKSVPVISAAAIFTFEPSGQGCLFPYTETPVTLHSLKQGKLPPAVVIDLEQKRRERGLTQEAVAAAIGVKRVTLCNAIKGRYGLSKEPLARLKVLLAA